jgi:hypothetical protein
MTFALDTRSSHNPIRSIQKKKTVETDKILPKCPYPPILPKRRNHNIQTRIPCDTGHISNSKVSLKRIFSHVSPDTSHIRTVRYEYHHRRLIQHSPSSRERNSVAHALPQSIRLPLQHAVLAASPSAQKASDRPAAVVVRIGCRPRTGTLGLRS